MTLLFTIIVIIACVGLIAFVLVQNPKGGGLNSEFGSAVQLGGAKRATDILEKGTWVLALLIAVVCLGLAAGGASRVSNPEEVEDLESDALNTMDAPGSEDAPDVYDQIQNFPAPGAGGNGE